MESSMPARPCVLSGVGVVAVYVELISFASASGTQILRAQQCGAASVSACAASVSAQRARQHAADKQHHPAFDMTPYAQPRHHVSRAAQAPHLTRTSAAAAICSPAIPQQNSAKKRDEKVCKCEFNFFTPG